MAQEHGQIAIGPDGGEHVARGPRNHRILCEVEALEVVELCFGPDFEGVGPHVHADQTDSFYVLEGEAEFFMAGETHRAGRGSFIAAPPGVEHGFRNAGSGQLKLLNVHSPNTGFAERMRRRLN